MFLLCLLLAGAVYGITFDDIKNYKCYSFSDKSSKKSLTCSVYVDEMNCTNYCSNDDTDAEQVSYHDHFNKKYSDTLCKISFNGRCGRKIDEDSGNICFDIIDDEVNFNTAMRDCKKRDSELYVPDNDNDLKSLIKLIDGKISTFWIGGGTIFWHKCGKAPANSAGVEVAVAFTIDDNKHNSLGYSRTRLVSQKAAYICARSPRRRENENCLTFNGIKIDPRYAIRPIQITNGLQISNMRMGRIPGGPLTPGESITFYMQQPTSGPAGNINWWTVSLFSSSYYVGFHMGARLSIDSCALSSIPTGQFWGGTWNKGFDVANCGYRAGNLQYTTLTNRQNYIEVNINGKKTFTFDKPSNVAWDYTFIGFQAPLVNVTATVRGVPKLMAISQETQYITYP